LLLCQGNGDFSEQPSYAAAFDGGEMTERIRFLSPKQVYELTSLSPRTQGRLADQGQFPNPILLFEGSRRIGFVESEVQAWQAARLAEARRPRIGARAAGGRAGSQRARRQGAWQTA
jgi:predicted DNA-binding transcriptional regulator AlpA